jgi:iron complex outermembrane receptor protein
LVSAGSYENYFAGASVRVAKNRFESRTSIYGESAVNNYSFKNNTIAGYPWERLNNSSATGSGFMQELNKRVSQNSMLTFSLLSINHNREIQPTVSNNSSPATYASIHDQMLRTSLKFTSNKGKFRYTTSISYACNNQEYKSDIIAANKVSALIESDYTIKNFSIKAGISSDYTKPRVYSYDSDTYEFRTNIFALTRFIPLRNLILSAGVRQMWVTGVNAPLMPSFDAKFIVNTGIRHSLSLRGSVSRSIKVPTLNDRYWGSNNLYLKSEKSVTAETGADYSFLTERINADAWFTVYRSDVTDWIRWLPAGSVWRPQNIPSVLSTGLEAGIKVSRNIESWRCGVNMNYNYSNIRMLESLMNEDPSVGRQLAYQPHHQFNTTIKGEHSGLTLFLTTLFTGRRTTVDIFDIMPAYVVFDAGAIYKFKMFGYKWTTTAKVMNLANKQYQNIKFYAMPGTNLRASLQWNF